MSHARFAPLLLLAAAGTAFASASSAATERPAAAPAPRRSHAALVGVYRLRGGPDTVSGLRLLANGRFQFGFSAGAIDLSAEGRWTSDGRTVILNTDPRPVPPVFSAGSVLRSGDAPLVVRVTSPAGRGLALVDLRLGFADGHMVEGYTQDDGWRLDDGEKPAAARWVELSLHMYGLPPQRFPLDPGAGNVFAFTLTPNDLGVQDFRDTALVVTRDGLILSLLGGSGTSDPHSRGQ
jgi:hypothetical protein